MARTRNTNLLSNAYNKQGYNPGFTDIFTATTKGMGSVNQKQPKNNTYEDRVIDSEIKNFNQAIKFDYDKVPPELLDQVKQHVNTMSKERGNLGLISSQMDSSDLSKIDLDQNRDMIDSGIAKLGGEFTILKQLRKGWKDDNDNNSISKMVSNEDKLKIHAILNNKLPMSFTPDGRIMFGEGDEAFGLDEMPSYYNKDSVSAGVMLTNYTSVFDEGKKLKDDKGNWNKFGDLYNNQFQQILTEGGDQSLLSLAFDDVGLETRDGGLLGHKADWQTQLDAINGDDPLAAEAAREELRTALTEQYMKTLNEQADKGWDEKELLESKTGGYTKQQQDVITRKTDRVAELKDPKNHVPGGEVIGYSGSGVNAVYFAADGDIPAGYQIVSQSTGKAHPAYGGKIYQPDDAKLHQVLRIYI